MYKNQYIQRGLLIIFLLLDLVIWGFKNDLEKADWAAWVGSIGTVGTMIGTIWLSMSQSYRARRDNIVKGKLIAASLQLRVSELHGAIESVCRSLKPFTVMDAGMQPLVECRELLESVDIWDPVYVTPIVYFDIDLANKLIEISTRAKTAINALSKQISIPKIDLLMERKKQAARLYYLLTATWLDMKETAEQCRNAGVSLKLKP